VKLFATQPAIF